MRSVPHGRRNNSPRDILSPYCYGNTLHCRKQQKNNDCYTSLNPNSSPITANMKSVSASDRKLPFFTDVISLFFISLAIQFAGTDCHHGVQLLVCQIRGIFFRIYKGKDTIFSGKFPIWYYPAALPEIPVSPPPVSLPPMLEDKLITDASDIQDHTEDKDQYNTGRQCRLFQYHDPRHSHQYSN